uniref:NADH dehydrogenase subunit 4 n=1 Tax=Mesocestoides sp. RKZ08 TaxID=2854038 RepID=UPI001F1343DD|nr:NADH dehydrogenase subunit 4 [Mesocestoides sp. RKZ08]UKS07965.1 NADH dehydrogenase subunit 4 [Mesocestoides sp. RKZ08]
MSMYNFISISFFLVFFFVFFTLFLFSGVNFVFDSLLLSVNNIFIFDSISFYLLLLVVFLGVYSQVSYVCYLDISVRFWLFVSLLCSCLCFCINHSVLFWCLYELSMLPLLYLIFKESPYSERFLAGWYFAGYLLITSLPLIIIMLYIFYINSSFVISSWSLVSDCSGIIYLVLCFVFFTKVPLVPFHTWLPVVHAEATSIVSIFLSGYIMKLGLLGVYRCCFFVFDFSFLMYVFICVIFCLGFFYCCNTELDGKRWLAFLSLAHIVVPFIGFFLSTWDNISVVFLYCLGHGLGAGLVFGLLWCFYDSSNTRNWMLLKSSISGNSVIIVVCLSLLSLCSFPTTIQFFCEVFLVMSSLGNMVFVLFWSFYLFFGGLIPLVMCGFLLIRNEMLETCNYSFYTFLFFLFYMLIWCYIGVFFI